MLYTGTSQIIIHGEMIIWSYSDVYKSWYILQNRKQKWSNYVLRPHVVGLLSVTHGLITLG